jgi:hypothetical protein
VREPTSAISQFPRSNAAAISSVYSTAPDSEDVREAMAGELKAAQKMAEGVDCAGEQIALQAQQHGVSGSPS